MQVPLQITFHDLAPSPALEARARKSVDELERLFDGIVSCHVAIEVPHRRHHQGRRYRVRIELGVPGEQLVVGHSADADATHEDANLALHDAFRAVRRRLADYVGRTRDRVKRPAA